MSEREQKSEAKYCIFASEEIIKASHDLKIAELSYLAGDKERVYERVSRAISRLNTYNLRKQGYKLGQYDIIKSLEDKVEKLREKIVKDDVADITPYTFEYLSNELLAYGENFTQLCQEKYGKFFFKITPRVMTKSVGKRKGKKEGEQK